MDTHIRSSSSSSFSSRGHTGTGSLLPAPVLQAMLMTVAPNNNSTATTAAADDTSSTCMINVSLQNHETLLLDARIKACYRYRFEQLARHDNGYYYDDTTKKTPQQQQEFASSQERDSAPARPLPPSLEKLPPLKLNFEVLPLSTSVNSASSVYSDIPPELMDALEIIGMHYIERPATASLQKLNWSEQYVLTYLLGYAYTRKEIASSLGISVMTVGRYYNEGMAKLRTALKD